MKKTLQLIIITLVILGFQNVNAQEIITGWNFESDVDTVAPYANVGLESNSKYYISADDTAAWPNTTQRKVTFSAGYLTFAATAEKWDNGANAKLWSVKFKAEGYKNLILSSRQFSDIDNPGPRDWKIQAQLSHEDWIDVSNSNITVANDWTTGVVEYMPLPAELDNPGSTSIYIRWIMTSDTAIDGSIVDSLGISKIDDIVISGTNTVGVNEVIFDSKFSFYPNPANGEYLNISSTKEISRIVIYNTNGQIVKEINHPQAIISIDNLKQGFYFIQATLDNNENLLPRKLIVQ